MVAATSNIGSSDVCDSDVGGSDVGGSNQMAAATTTCTEATEAVASVVASRRSARTHTGRAQLA